MLDLGVIDLLVPVLVLILAILYLPVTLIAILVNGKFTEFVSWKSFQQAWFSRFWHFFGWASRPLFAPDVEKVLAAANGVVLDIGTGSGDWLYLFTETRNKKISKLCLVEPNSDFHPVVQRRVRELGLAEKCQIISGVDLLERCGVQPGTVDTVSTVHVLCSVETPGPLAKTLYHYLKPGGQWLVYEHVKARNGWKVAAAWQGDLSLHYLIC